jgi:hypothetical protein
MKPHGQPRPVQDDPDSMFDEAVDALRRLKRHVPHGRIVLLLERDEGMTIGHELGSGHTTAQDIARFMSATPGRK